MSRYTTSLLIGLILLAIVSISATFYRTIVLQDFDISGVWIEFPTEDSSYVWFIYDNEEYELELETTEYDVILETASEELAIPVSQLDEAFLEYMEYAYAEALVAAEETIE